MKDIKALQNKQLEIAIYFDYKILTDKLINIIEEV